MTIILYRDNGLNRLFSALCLGSIIIVISVYSAPLNARLKVQKPCLTIVFAVESGSRFAHAGRNRRDLSNGRFRRNVHKADVLDWTGRTVNSTIPAFISDVVTNHVFQPLPSSPAPFLHFAILTTLLRLQMPFKAVSQEPVVPVSAVVAPTS